MKKNWANSSSRWLSCIEEYLSRYTHKVAITSHRITGISEENVKFKYKDYADADKQKEMNLSIPEILRRFELHILPKSFVKIRHYGLLQNHGKIKRINTVREQLKIGPLPVKVQIAVSQRMLEKYGKDITLCSKCKRGKLELICTSYPHPNRQTRLKLNENKTLHVDLPDGNFPP